MLEEKKILHKEQINKIIKKIIGMTKLYTEES